MSIDGIGFTTIFFGAETQPVMLSVKITVVIPSDIPVMSPVLMMLTIPGFIEFHVPPEEGSI